MDKKKQMHAPVYEALEKLKKRRVVPFDVPGYLRTLFSLSFLFLTEANISTLF